jgi:antirestriction protein ArdC
MKRDIYIEITDRVIEMLEKGVAPWRKPWKCAGLLPTNLKSRKIYRGINLLVLSMTEHTSPFWVTFNQAKELGGRIKAGEKGTTVVLWKFLRAFERGESGEIREDRVPLMRHYTIFNLDQTDGIDVPKPDGESQAFDSIEAVEKIIADMPEPPEIRHGGARASYDSRGDIVSMPPRSAFTSSSAYYSTLLHEIGHSTGNVKRLARPAIVNGGHFGAGDYSKEELVAEFTSAFLCARVGIENEIEQSAAYLQGWLSALRDDRRVLVQAAGLAQRAADYVLNVHFDERESSEPIRHAEDLAIAA